MKKLSVLFDTISFGFVTVVTAFFSLMVLSKFLIILFDNPVGRSLDRFASRNRWEVWGNSYVMWILPITCGLVGYFLMQENKKTSDIGLQSRFFR